jgi:hypothetical protein
VKENKHEGPSSGQLAVVHVKLEAIEEYKTRTCIQLAIGEEIKNAIGKELNKRQMLINNIEVKKLKWHQQNSNQKKKTVNTQTKCLTINDEEREKGEQNAVR